MPNLFPRKYIHYVLSVWIFSSCIDSFDPSLSAYEDVLVVDGLISNIDTTYTVFLSRTVSNIDEDVPTEEGAIVQITDDVGNTETLTEVSSGKYQSNPETFTGKIGHSYQLHIKTADGKEYESDTCYLNPPYSIDSISYQKDKEWNADNSEEQDGLAIYINASPDKEASTYLRWSYQEDWKFSIPQPENYYIAPDNSIVYQVAENVYCYKSNASSEIILHSLANLTTDQVTNKLVYFIPSGESDRLTNRYTTLITQYTISKEEYEFWNKLEESTEDVEDIFGSQPYSLTGNISNINDPDEMVAGYFQVAGVSTQRIFIDYNDIYQLGLPMGGDLDCQIDSLFLEDYLGYSLFTLYSELKSNGYGFVAPIQESNVTIGLIRCAKVCSDCTKTGDIDPPSYWVD
jgi:hypothetical protein